VSSADTPPSARRALKPFASLRTGERLPPRLTESERSSSVSAWPPSDTHSARSCRGPEQVSARSSAEDGPRYWRHPTGAKRERGFVSNAGSVARAEISVESAAEGRDRAERTEQP